MKRLCVALFCLAIATAAMAADFLTMGCDYYNKGQYDKALAYLQAVTSKSPKVWKGHYYLANTYLQLGQRDNALEEYRKARALNPTPDVAAACDRIIGQIVSHAVRHSGMPAYDRKYDSARQDYVNAQKRYIIDKTDTDAKRLKSDRDYIIDSGQSVAADKASLHPYASVEQKARAAELQMPTSKKIRSMYDETNDRLREMK